MMPGYAMYALQLAAIFTTLWVLGECSRDCTLSKGYSCKKDNPCGPGGLCEEGKLYYQGATPHVYVACVNEEGKEHYRCEERTCYGVSMWNEDKQECINDYGVSTERCGRLTWSCSQRDPCSPSRCIYTFDTYPGTSKEKYVRCTEDNKCLDEVCRPGHWYASYSRRCVPEAFLPGCEDTFTVHEGKAVDGPDPVFSSNSGAYASHEDCRAVCLGYVDCVAYAVLDEPAKPEHIHLLPCYIMRGVIKQYLDLPGATSYVRDGCYSKFLPKGDDEGYDGGKKGEKEVEESMKEEL